jgi:hypothetical protein
MCKMYNDNKQFPNFKLKPESKWTHQLFPLIYFSALFFQKNKYKVG